LFALSTEINLINPKNNNLKQIAFCGLCCPQCAKMKIADAAEVLYGELQSAREKNINIPNQDQPLDQSLKNLINMRCQKFCRDGGGSPDCEIRKCCQRQGIDGCWQCPQFNQCSKLNAQFIRNIEKIRKVGIDEYQT